MHKFVYDRSKDIVQMTLADFMDLVRLTQPYKPDPPLISDTDPILDTVPHKTSCWCRTCRPAKPAPHV